MGTYCSRRDIQRLLGGVVAHEVYDEVVRCWHDDDCGECSGELDHLVSMRAPSYIERRETYVVRIIRNTLILRLLKLRPKLVQSVPISAILNSNVVNFLETRDVEGMSVTVVDVSVPTTDAGVSLVGIVRVRETLSRGEEWRSQLVGWEGSADRPDAFNGVSACGDGVDCKDGGDAGSQVVEGSET